MVIRGVCVRERETHRDRERNRESTVELGKQNPFLFGNNHHQNHFS